MTEKDLLVKESCITFSGLFSFDSTEFKHGFAPEKYANYEQLPEIENSFDYYRTLFYPNFCDNVISKKVHSKHTIRNNTFRHLLLKDIDQFNCLELKTDTDSIINFSITKAELFLFNDLTVAYKNEMLGIYSFSININEPEISLNLVSLFISKIRLLASKNRIKISGIQYSTLEFIENFIVHRTLSHDLISSIMGNKLKTYSVTNLQNEILEYRNLLFDLATASLVRLNDEKSFFSPSQKYCDSIYERHSISVFNNWHALSLFDSFTVLGFNISNIDQTWGTTYHFIYVHCLRMKFYMFRVNAELTNITSLEKNSEQLRNSFIEYIDKHNFKMISYNFLPNLIYQKINQSLDIQAEINDLEHKISNISLLFKEAIDKRLNKILLLVAILGLSSGILATSTLIMKISSISEDNFFPFGGAILSFIIFTLVIIYFFKNSHKINK